MEVGLIGARHTSIETRFTATEAPMAMTGSDPLELIDIEEPYKSMTHHNEVKYRVSDHRPIWIRLQIDGNDDDSIILSLQSWAITTNLPSW